MSRRTFPRVNVNIISAAIIAVIIVVILISPGWGPPSPMDKLLIQLNTHIMNETWVDAANTMKELQVEWDARRNRLYFNNARNALQRFEQQLSRVRAGIDVRDLSTTAVDAKELAEMWNEFTD